MSGPRQHAQALVAAGLRHQGETAAAASRAAEAAWREIYAGEAVAAAAIDLDLLYSQAEVALGRGAAATPPAGWQLRARRILQADAQGKAFVTRAELIEKLTPVVAKWSPYQVAHFLVHAAGCTPLAGMASVMQDAGLDPDKFTTDVQPLRIVLGVQEGQVLGAASDAAVGEVELVVADHDIAGDQASAVEFIDPAQGDATRAVMIDHVPKASPEFVWAAYEAMKAAEAADEAEEHGVQQLPEDQAPRATAPTGVLRTCGLDDCTVTVLVGFTASDARPMFVTLPADGLVARNRISARSDRRVLLSWVGLHELRTHVEADEEVEKAVVAALGVDQLANFMLNPILTAKYDVRVPGSALVVEGSVDCLPVLVRMSLDEAAECFRSGEEAPLAGDLAADVNFCGGFEVIDPSTIPAIVVLLGGAGTLSRQDIGFRVGADLRDFVSPVQWASFQRNAGRVIAAREVLPMVSAPGEEAPMWRDRGSGRGGRGG